MTENCPHHFGYLRQRLKSEEIRGACMVCVKLVDCVLSKPETPTVITQAENIQDASESNPSTQPIKGESPIDAGVKEAVRETQRSRDDETVNKFKLRTLMKRIRGGFKKR